VDQATLVGYGLGYFATMIAVFIMFLPAFIILSLLLLLAGAVQLALLLLNAVASGLHRTLIRPLATLTDRLRRPRRRRGGTPVPH
jgi:hypothetical protein